VAKKEETKDNLPAVQGQSFNLAIGGDVVIAPELLAEVTTEDFAGYDSSRAALPIVSIRQKDLKNDKGGLIAQAGGFRIYDPVTAASNIVIPDQDKLTVTFLIEHSTRTYWQQGNMADPDCRAGDGLFGIGNPGGECAKCPLSQWVDDKRPACNLNANVLSYDHNSQICYVLRFGRSGLKPWSYYKELVKRIANGQLPVHGTIAQLTTQYMTEPAPHYIPVLTMMSEQPSLELFRLFKKFRFEWLEVLKRTAIVDVEETETVVTDGELPPGVTPVYQGHAQVAKQKPGDDGDLPY
jgi:hypothetical protein